MAKQSHIEQLIQKMCPNGIPYSPLGELCRSIKTGLNPRKNFVLNVPDSTLYYVTVKEITTGKIVFSDKTDRITKEAWCRIQERSALEKDDILFSGIGTIGKVAIVDIPTDNWNCSESVFLIKPDKSLVLPKFLMYYLGSEPCKEQYESVSVGSTMKGVRKVTLESLQIPLPPLPIQNEVVHILDTLSYLIDNIDEEINARKKQFESTREALLNNDCPLKTLGEIGEFKRGNGLQKKDFSESGVGCIHYGQIYTKLGTYLKQTLTYVPNELASKQVKAHHGNLVIACTGETIEDLCKSVAWMGKEDIVIGGHSAVYRHEQDPLYISYFFQTQLFAKQKAKYTIGAKVYDIKTEDIAKIQIPLPSLKEQQAIAEKLDTIEAFIANLNEERTLRQQQYEYYRAKLISLLK